MLGSFMANAQNSLTPEKMMELKRISGGTVSPDGNYLLYAQTTISVEENKGNADLFVLNLKTKAVQQLTDTPVSESSAQWVNGNKIYYMANDNDVPTIWKMNVDGSNKTKVSENGKEIEDFKVSADESVILTLQSVQIRKNINQTYEDLPKADARVENDLLYRHWSTWDDYTAKHIFYFPLTNGKISGEGKDLLQGENFSGIVPPFGDLGGVTFTPDNKSVIYSSKKKLGKEFALSTNSELYQVELSTGKTVCLTCNNEFKGYESAPSFSSKGDMAWLAMERDGFESDKNNLIVKTTAGKVVNLTANYDITISDYAWNGDGTKLYFLVPTKGTVQVFEVVLKTGVITQLTNDVCDYTSVSVFGNTIYAGRQSMIQPTELYAIQVIAAKKGAPHSIVTQLTNVNGELLSKLDKPTVEEKWVKTTDGKDMLVWMILPPNFDASKKYPALLYCQGGPQSEVSQFFSYRWNFMVMASQGYVVVAPNRRGLPGFGQEWNDAISKDWGGQSIQDYLSAIDAAAELPYVDKDRLGCVGASYGGYSVYMLAGVHQKRFKTFIAHAGLFNLESWYGMTEELFFAKWDIGGPYWEAENKEAFVKNSPHRYVQNWDTPIMVIHGAMDFRVPESEGMQAYQVAQLKGIKSRFLHFPTENHWIMKPQNALVWHREFYKWLAEDLHPEKTK
ncbi:MAG: S9 family peptidase [Crocinitomicaceae bacterium]|nr:S9 family peptidase [Crocinitomicaceae bacterium]